MTECNHPLAYVEITDMEVSRIPLVNPNYEEMVTTFLCVKCGTTITRTRVVPIVEKA